MQLFSIDSVLWKIPLIHLRVQTGHGSWYLRLFELRSNATSHVKISFVGRREYRESK